MACVGIDFGNRNAVVAIARRGGIDICCNEASNRVTPSMVSFSGEQRHVGEAALTILTQNFKNTCTDLKRYLGLPYNSPFLAANDYPRALYQLVAESAPRGYVAARVRYGKEGDEREFRFEALVAMLLAKLQAIAVSENGGTPVLGVVLSVPGWYTQSQRRAMMDAAKIANVSILKLMNEHAAVVLGYGIFRTAQLPEKDPITVGFVDIGHTSTTVTIAAFTNTKAEVRAVTFDPALGGRDFDQVLFDHFADTFKSKYGIDPRGKPRPTLRLRTECERLKKVLSANSEAPLNIECFMEDIDVRAHVKREDFEALLKPMLDRIEVVCRNAIAAANLQPGQLDSVEILGGSTRIPAIKALIETVFKVPLKTTINADECIARGCALQCAALSPVFRVREYGLVDVAPYGVSVIKKFEDDPTQHEAIRVIPKLTPFPAVKAISFPNQGPVALDIAYGDDEALTKQLGVGDIGKFRVDAPKPQDAEDKAKVRVKVKLDMNGVIDVAGAQLMKEIEVDEVAEPAKAADAMNVDKKDEAVATGEEKMDVEAPKPADSVAEAAPIPDTPASSAEEPKVKKVKKATTVDLTVKRSDPALTEDEMNKLIAEEGEMRAADTYLKEKADARNSLESYVYSMRSRIDNSGDLRDYETEEKRASFRAKLDATEEWVYSDDSEAASKSDTLKRLSELEALAAPILKRKYEADNRDQHVANLFAQCDSYKAVAIPNKEEFNHLSEDEKNTILLTVEKAELWCQDSVRKQNATPKHADAVLTCDALIKRLAEVRATCHPIFTKKKPAPPPPPPKTEEPKDDVKMAEKVPETASGAGAAAETPGDQEMADGTAAGTAADAMDQTGA